MIQRDLHLQDASFYTWTEIESSQASSVILVLTDEFTRIDWIQLSLTTVSLSRLAISGTSIEHTQYSILKPSLTIVDLNHFNHLKNASLSSLNIEICLDNSVHQVA